jgi:MoaA/NifB/PqqE/SkfB family radical SAM enzyme
MKQFNEVFPNVDSVDLYVNYVCGLRCNHCFIGDLLNTNVDLPIELAKSIVSNLAKSGVKSITLLGGEPTLYKNIYELIECINENKLYFRIVTNGQKSFQKFIKKLDSILLNKLHVCFSIDGSNSKIHDDIRGKGVYLNLINSIELAKLKKISISAITSISKDNYNDTISIIDFCSILGMKYINVHYVTDRGFATKNKVVSIQDWLKLCENIEANSADIKIRLEKTFISKQSTVKCEVPKKENIIIDPNGKIYGCTMFMNLTNMESGIWTLDGIELNKKNENENSICNCTNNGCPAMPLVNNDLVKLAKKDNYKMDCIFNKTTI